MLGEMRERKKSGIYFKRNGINHILNGINVRNCPIFDQEGHIHIPRREAFIPNEKEMETATLPQNDKGARKWLRGEFIKQFQNAIYDQICQAVGDKITMFLERWPDVTESCIARQTYCFANDNKKLHHLFSWQKRACGGQNPSISLTFEFRIRVFRSSRIF